MTAFFINGARGRTRTGMDLTPQHFECCAYTNFATRACHDIIAYFFQKDNPLNEKNINFCFLTIIGVIIAETKRIGKKF